MADIRINDLPLATGGTAPVGTDSVPIDGLTTRKTTIAAFGDVAVPIASQADAEAGVNSAKRMTPLTTKQSIASEVGVTLASKAQGDLASTSLQSDDIGSTIQAFSANLNTLSAVVPGASGVSILSMVAVTDVRNYLDATPYVATRTALKAIDTTKETCAILTESGREGIFVWTIGDYSAQITADTLEGVFVKANAIAASSGAWVRMLSNNQSLSPLWFGAVAVPLTDTSSTFDSYSALQGCINVMMLLKRGMQLPPGKIRSNTKLLHTFTPSATGPSDNKNTYGCFRIRGSGNCLSELYFPNNDGIELVASSFQHVFDIADFCMTTGAAGGWTAFKVRNTFAYFGEYNAKNYFNIDMHGSDGYGNVNFWGVNYDFFNISNIKGGGLLSGTVSSATVANDTTYKNYGIGIKIASAADPDSNPGTPNSTEPGWGTQYDFTGMRFNFIGLCAEIGAGIQGVEFGPGTKMLVGYSGVEILPGVTEVRQIHLNGVEISGKGTPFRARSAVPSLKIDNCHIAFGSGKNGVVLETNTGAANGGGSTICANTFNASEAGASDAVYVNTSFNAISINDNVCNGMNTGFELTASAGAVNIGAGNSFTNVNNPVIDASAARLNNVPPMYDRGNVTQLTSKTTAVTLNKRSGIITTNSSALAAGASNTFTFNNSRYKAGDTVSTTTRNNNNYSVRSGGSADGVITVTVKNETAGALGDPVFIDFALQPAS